MSFAKKAYNATEYMRLYRVHNEMVANDDPEYSVYVRPRRRKKHLPDSWDDVFIRHQKTWKVKRRTQYRPKGRNAYKIIFKYKCEKEEISVQTQFATSDEWKSATFRYSCDDLKSFRYLWNIEEEFKFQGIVIQEFWKEPDPENLTAMCIYKVYGDRKEGVRRYFQESCDRCGEQMEVEYI